MKRRDIKMDARPIAWKPGEGEMFLPWDTFRHEYCWGVLFEDGAYYTPFIDVRQVRRKCIARLLRIGIF